MKKLIAIALLFLCLLTFFGCGQKNGFSCTTNEYGSIILDLPGEDQVMTCAQSEEGVLARVFAALGQHALAVVEYFS